MLFSAEESVLRHLDGIAVPFDIDDLAAAGAQVYRTDECGLITVYVSPEGELSISTFLEEP